MKTVYAGQVLASQLLPAIKSGWHSMRVIRITYYARKVVNSGGEFLLRECEPQRLIKLLSVAVLSSCTEFFNCKWNNLAICRYTGLFGDCGFSKFVCVPA